MKIKKNDKVLILAGKDKGKTGPVERIIKSKSKVVVTGVAMTKKHLKPNQQNRQGGIQEFSAPISVSNVKLICPKCDKPARVEYDKNQDKKERKCKKCSQVI